MDRFHHPGLSPTQCRQLDRFADLLRQGNRRLNLTRVTDFAGIYLRHFVDSLEVLPILDARGAAGRLLDVGSGAGLPGLVLAVARPAWSVVSLEATGKKAQFQREVVADLGLVNVEVLQGRAEELGRDPRHRQRYDVVTARAVAALPVLVELCLPLAAVGGQVVALKGPDAAREAEQAREAARRLGGRIDRVEPYRLQVGSREGGSGRPGEVPTFHRVTISKVTTTPREYPRPYGAIRRCPL